MGWVTTGGAVNERPDGSLTTTIESRYEGEPDGQNNPGDTRTVRRTKDVNGNVVEEETRIRRENGDVEWKRIRTRGNRRQTERRTRRTIRHNGRVTTITEEFVDGVKRRSSTQTTHHDGEHAGRSFKTDATYDEHGNLEDSDHFDVLPDGTPRVVGYHRHPHGLNDRLVRDVDGHAVLPGVASAGAPFGGLVPLPADEAFREVVVRDASGSCFETTTSRTGHFVVPTGFTTEGECAVEVLDREREERVSDLVEVVGPSSGDAVLSAVVTDDRTPRLSRGTGRGLAPLEDDDLFAETHHGPLVVLDVDGSSVGKTRPVLAFSDREVVFETPPTESVARIYVGDGVQSNGVEASGTRPC